MHSRVAAIVGLAIALSSLVASWSSPYIQFDQRLIPELPGPLPILTLGPHASIPQNLLQQLVRSTDPNATLTTDSTTGDQFAYHGDNLIAFVNASSGETRVFPNLGVLEPRIRPINANLTFQYISDTNMFPVDHTNISLAKGADLAGSIAISGHDPTAPQVFLSHFVVQRNITVDDISYPVCGPGSKASFGFGADQNLRSLSYLWQPATFSGHSVRPDSTHTIFDSIIQQLIPVSSSTNILRVDGVDICFYDSTSRYIQPVYRFSATLHADTVDSVASAPIRILGYLPIGRDSPEPVPCISKPSDVSTQPTFPNSTISSRTEKRQARPSITVGRYVVRNDTYQWVINANNFLNNLQHPSSGTSVADFVDKQYYWAYPFEFTSQKNTYINSVQIAETEVHGNWHVFSTNSNCCDLVHLADIPPDGYGGGANGSLAYWIIHSCEVIPTPTDYAAADFHLAFDVWFSIFNGLHAVVGYRTEMRIADSVMPTFGSLISIGAPFVPAWLQTVHDDIADYGARPGNFYLDGNRHIIEPMGRASAVVVCGHEQDNVLRTENLGRPICLREFCSQPSQLLPYRTTYRPKGEQMLHCYTEDTVTSLQKGRLSTQISIQLVELVHAFNFFFLELKSVRVPAAGPAITDLPVDPTLATPSWPWPAFLEAIHSSSDDGEIVFRGMAGAVIARRNDAGDGERSGCQQSKNGDLHGSGKARS